jgi:hypothetical protein
MHFFYPLCFFLSLLSAPLWAQTAAEDCRLDPEELEPVIRRFNPFFADHQWKAETRIEMARMSQERLLVIAQDACKRHHTKLTLIIETSAVENHPAFWMEEVKGLMYKAYWQQPEYEVFGRAFDQAFTEKFAQHGVNSRFNFPVGTRNFICDIRFQPGRGAKVSVEMVSFIFKERVARRQQGIPKAEDDGWLGQRKSRGEK